MDYTNDEKALIYLSACSNLELRDNERLLSLGKSPHEVFESLQDILPFALSKENKFPKSTLANREAELNSLLSRMEKKGYFAITRVSADYPVQLAAIENAPLVLFCAGNRNLLKEKIFTIVGSRRTPSYAEAFGTKLAEEISDYFAVATGLAEGGDYAALKGAIKKKRAICILPCGIDECYPAAHLSMKEKVIKEGLLLSEMGLDEKIRKYSFHARNRILAGISFGTLVLSAGEKSGALITANYCADYGRELFAVPYPVGSFQGAGCNKLIKQGANLCDCTQDILNYFGIFMKEKKALPPLSEVELKIISEMADGEEMHAYVIARRLNMQIFDVTSLLAGLEMKQIVVKTGGNCYRIIR